jgi:hypothetical protein
MTCIPPEGNIVFDYYLVNMFMTRVAATGWVMDCRDPYPVQDRGMQFDGIDDYCLMENMVIGVTYTLGFILRPDAIEANKS